MLSDFMEVMECDFLGVKQGCGVIEIIYFAQKLFSLHIFRNIRHCIMSHLGHNQFSNKTFWMIVRKEIHGIENILWVVQIEKVNIFTIARVVYDSHVGVGIEWMAIGS
jgi:hypothetical protein